MIIIAWRVIFHTLACYLQLSLTLVTLILVDGEVEVEVCWYYIVRSG